jgi:cupin fold WbuC family metalloprotein
MKLLPTTLLDDLAAKASASPRRRSHHNLHASSSDVVQRFFVAVDRDSYIRPHRHSSKSELALVLRGTFGIVTFDDDGVVTARYIVGEGTANMGFELPPATWHTLFAMADGSAFLEIKEGPYDPATAAEFAAWAPAEGDPAVTEFLRRVRDVVVGARLVT